MRRVQSEDTAPERTIRSLLHRLGLRFRLHRKDLPGKPDIVLPRFRIVIFVHGCFWHRHRGCPNASTPATHRSYWLPKFQRTQERDKENQGELRQNGWKVMVVWECQLKSIVTVIRRIRKLVDSQDPKYTIAVAPIALVAEGLLKYRSRRASKTTRSTSKYSRRE